jgi:hypothetical protein
MDSSGGASGGVGGRKGLPCWGILKVLWILVLWAPLPLPQLGFALWIFFFGGTGVLNLELCAWLILVLPPVLSYIFPSVTESPRSPLQVHMPVLYLSVSLGGWEILRQEGSQGHREGAVMPPLARRSSTLQKWPGQRR